MERIPLRRLALGLSITSSRKRIEGAAAELVRLRNGLKEINEEISSEIRKIGFALDKIIDNLVEFKEGE